MVAVSEHPSYAKFFKMLKVGIPPHVVKVCMCVCMYVCMYVCVPSMHQDLSRCMYYMINIDSCIFTRIHACIYGIHTYIPTYICTYIHTYI